MKSWQVTSYDGVAALQHSDIEEPGPAPGQVRFRVHASSVNPIDWKLAKGVLKWLRPMKFPWVTTFDGAGVVDAVGSGVQGWRIGDRLAVRLGTKGGGAAAEFAVASTDMCAHVPDNVDFEQAAGVPLAGMTAWQGLFGKRGLPASGNGLRVLIVGASGGVGHLAVQLALETGAEVIGVCSTPNVETVRSLGAHDVIDYRNESDYSRCGPYDLIYDTVGVGLDACRPWLKKSGSYRSPFPSGKEILASLTSRLLPGPSVHLVMLKPSAANLTQLMERLGDGRLKVLIDSRFDADALPEAWARSMEGRAVGKIILRHVR
ncbi:MAG: NADP-dependent oxidoreductase [Myxococcales bacterium]|nr:NADP-dependent oxidoreductase [Myxococcales bacterium]